MPSIGLSFGPVSGDAVSGVEESVTVVPVSRSPLEPVSGSEPASVGVGAGASLLLDEHAYTAARDPKITTKGRIRRFIVGRL
jgi:hypothetical protein